MDINIGIPSEDRKAIADGLSRLLADSYTLYLKTHNFHWNVTGPMFNTLHAMFMQQYTELWNAVDPIAAMPGQSRISVDRLVGILGPLVEKGLPAVIIFGVPENITKVSARRVRVKSGAGRASSEAGRE